MSSSNESAALRMIVFDQYQRYRFIQQMVEAISGPESKNILEIGGAFSSPLASLLPQHNIIVLDKLYEAPNVDIRASALNLPFEDHAFEIVVSTDVLEHLTPEERPTFLQEMQRVTSQVLILGFPFNTPLNNEAERILFEFITCSCVASLELCRTS
jgi:hypothetical protein